MKKNLFLVFLLTTLALPAFGQLESCLPYCTVDPGSGGGGSGGSGDSGFCFTCDDGNSGGGGDTHWVCESWWRGAIDDGAWFGAFAGCQAHNLYPNQQGASYCEVFMPECIAEASDNGHVGELSPEAQIIGITAYFMEAKRRDHSPLITKDALDAFIASTDDELRGQPYATATQKRLAAYRHKFAVLQGGRELRKGAIPVIGHRRPPKDAPPTTPL